MPPKRPAARGGRSAASTSSTNAQPQPAASSSSTLADQSSDSLTAPEVTAASSAAPSAAPAKRPDTSQPVPPVTSSARGRGGRPLARPRGIARRSQVDRVDLQQQQQERRAAEAAQQAREQAWRQRRDNARGRGRGSIRARTRGGYAGETERRKDAPMLASGPFSLGEVNKYKHARSAPTGSGTRAIAGSSAGYGGGGGGGGGHGSGGGGSSGTKGEYTPAVSDIRVKQEDGGYVSSDAEDDDPKLNVDKLIDLTAEDDEDDAYLPPVRITRVEHKERNLVGTTDTSKTSGNDSIMATGTDKRRKNLKAADVEITRETQRYKGTYTDSESEDDAPIKAEPPLDDDPAISQNPIDSPPTSPETRRKAKERIKAGTLLGDTEKPSFQTKEEELEWEIHERDLRILRNELGSLTLPPPADSETAPNATDDPRADKVYLFQLPAILPGLVPVIPKSEDEDVNMLDIPETIDPAGSAKLKKPVIDNTAALPASGLVGKLRVHASGKAYLDWGGIPMEVKMGQDANFLQDIVVLDKQDSSAAQPEDAAEPVGQAMSMGQVKGKFVVVPEWDKIFEEAA